ncbi:MAG: zinc-binding dehydrogenase [candidate division Zixibacteria bacterium]|nr:zinc-binding dehydrogenase [candidate division Zixibacteria bacterium]
MKRVVKPEGKFRILLEEVPVPAPGPGEVRIKAVCSLISRGSELGGRYTREHAINPDIMGYSLAGIVDETGEGVEHLAVGDRVAALAPHAEYVVRSARVAGPEDQAWVVPLLPAISFEQATYYPLVASAVTWVEIEAIRPGDTVVIVGQGLVGSLILQVAKAAGIGRLVAIDTLDSRCALAEEFGADVVIDASQENPVRAVRKLTSGVGAEIVVYAVGGPAGPTAFEQSLDMLATGGLLHLVGLYEDQALPLLSGKIQRRRLLGGHYGLTNGTRQSLRAMQLIASGSIHTDRMTTHRFSFVETAEAFDLLYRRPAEAFGVVLDWTAAGRDVRTGQAG